MCGITATVCGMRKNLKTDFAVPQTDLYHNVTIYKHEGGIDMKKMGMIITCSIIMILGGVQFAAAGISESISYQGVLTDTNGTPLNGSYAIHAKIYNVLVDGSSLWAGTYDNVEVKKGVFNIMLGDPGPNNERDTFAAANLDFEQKLYLGITVGTGTELTPRIELTSVGSALIAKDVVDGAVTRDKIVNGEVTLSKLNSDVTLSSLSGSLPVTRLTGNNVNTVNGQTGNVTITIPTVPTVGASLYLCPRQTLCSNLENACIGQLSISSTCKSYNLIDGSCYVQNPNYPCTYVGKLIQ